MEKATRAELIAALVTDRYSGFKEGDESLLEAASDERLQAFRSAADAAKVAAGEKTKLETDLRNTSARLKVAEDRLKANESTLTEEEFIARAPAPLKAVIEGHKTLEAQHKASLVAALKTCGANSEDELKTMSIPELEKLAKYARVQVVDYSGRGLPVERNASDKNVSYAPPDPYAAGIKALQTAGK